MGDGEGASPAAAEGMVPERRVKVYELEDEGWSDRGTGSPLPRRNPSSTPLVRPNGSD